MNIASVCALGAATLLCGAGCVPHRIMARTAEGLAYRAPHTITVSIPEDDDDNHHYQPEMSDDARASCNADDDRLIASHHWTKDEVKRSSPPMGHKRMEETMLYVHVAEDHPREIPPVVLAAGARESDPDRRVLAMLSARGAIDFGGIQVASSTDGNQEEEAIRDVA